MLQKNRDNISYVIAYDLTYRKPSMISFLNENGYFLSENPSDLEVANKLFSFLTYSQKNAEKYSSFLLQEEHLNAIGIIAIVTIVSAVVSAGTGTASVIQKGKQGRQQLARLATQGISQEEALQLSAIESRRVFLTNLFTTQQQIIQEDEKAFRRSEMLKKISISFLVLTLILGSVWLARKKM